MLHGFAAHYLLVSPGNVVRRGGVLVDEEGIVMSVFCLDDARVEPANVSFVDGFIAPFCADVSALSNASLKDQLLLEQDANRAAILLNKPAHLFNFMIDECGRVSVHKLV